MDKEHKQLVKEIEAILFYIAEPVSYSYLSKILNTNEKNIRLAVEELSQSLSDRGVGILIHNNTVALTTSPDMSKIVEKVIKEERDSDLGKASMETLTIIAYKGPVTRKEIEYIRGVNCQFALHTLLLRGLIERKTKEGDERSFTYTVTMDTLMHLGLKQLSDLPEYSTVIGQLNVVEEETEDEAQTE